jgi:hypothetical protein
MMLAFLVDQFSLLSIFSGLGGIAAASGLWEELRALPSFPL